MSAIQSSYSECPIEVREAIADQLCPKANASKEELQKCAQDLAALSATDKRISPYCQKKLERIRAMLEVDAIFPKWPTLDNLTECVEVLTWVSQKEDLEPYCLRKIEEVNLAIQLVTKYREGNSAYNTFARHGEPKDERWAGGPPHLVEIFASLMPNDYPSSIRQFDFSYNEEVEEDIIKIIDVLPQSLHCKMGNSRRYQRYSPLALASVNYISGGRIPLYIIEYLLVKGSNPNDTVVEEGEIEIPLLVHVTDRKYIRPAILDNIANLIDLFRKYGVDDASYINSLTNCVRDQMQPLLVQQREDQRVQSPSPMSGAVGLVLTVFGAFLMHHASHSSLE